jgi:POT family proton-dependent oligopeptide transporter
MPAGMPYIIGNEFAEEFSMGGMSCILIVYMTQYLFNDQGGHQFTGPQAMVWYHNFLAGATFFAIIGAIISDVFLGKYRTIITFSIIYCFGHLILSIFNTKFGLACGLGLIAIGYGGIAPCVSSNLGDQFNRKNYHLADKAYSWFYFAINIGAFIAMILVPYLLELYGAHIAFAAPAALMFVATIIFYQGKKALIMIPPIGLNRYIKELKDPDNLKAIGNLAIVFVFISFFHALYDQLGSSWVIQAGKMNRDINLGFIKFTLDQSQIRAVNPIFILIFLPFFYYIIYPFFEKFTKVTYLKKIATGFFVTAISFAIIAHIQTLLEHGQVVGIIWQILAYALITAAEILVMVTSLSMSYMYSPKSMKSLSLAIYILSMSLGNKMTANITSYLQDTNGDLIIPLSDYFWYFTYSIILIGILFVVYMPYYKGKVYLQITTIKEILEVILEAGRRRIALIALSGSFANRNISEDINPIRNMKYEHTDNYNFLILTKERRKEGLREIGVLSSIIAREFIRQGLASVALPSINNNINFTFKSINRFKLDLKQGQQFSDFEKNSLYLYRSSNFRLSELMEYSAEQSKSIVEISYRHFYNNGLTFLNFTKDFKYKTSNLGLVAFQLHQAAENFYHCALLFLAGDRPRTHKLKNLNLLLCQHSDQFNNIFPVLTKDQEDCFNLLEKAYLARYDINYKISTKQLEYLINNVKKLKRITQEICAGVKT